MSRVIATLKGGLETGRARALADLDVEDAPATSVIERLHEEFRRRVKTQGSLPSEHAALILLFKLVASGQIKLRRIDGRRKSAGVISQHTGVAA